MISVRQVDTVAQTTLQVPDTWTVVGQVGSLIAGLAALGTVYLAWKTVGMTLEERQTEHQYEYYRSLIFGPADSALSRFRRECHDNLREAIETIAYLRGKDERAQVVMSAVRSHNEDLVYAWEALRDTIMTGLEAWGDPSLTTEVRQELESLQDDFTKEMQSLAGRENLRANELSEVLRNRTSSILGAIMKRDPGMERFED